MSFADWANDKLFRRFESSRTSAKKKHLAEKENRNKIAKNNYCPIAIL